MHGSKVSIIQCGKKPPRVPNNSVATGESQKVPVGGELNEWSPDVKGVISPSRPPTPRVTTQQTLPFPPRIPQHMTQAILVQSGLPPALTSVEDLYFAVVVLGSNYCLELLREKGPNTQSVWVTPVNTAQMAQMGRFPFGLQSRMMGGGRCRSRHREGSGVPSHD